MFSAEFLHTDMPGMSHAHCASIAVAPGGELLATWYVYPEDETQGARLVIARKPGPAAPWSTGVPVDMNVVSSMGNPTLFLDPSGILWLHFVTLRGAHWGTAQWQVARSEDLGRTFPDRHTVSQTEGIMIRHAPVVLPGGRALMPIYDEKSMTSLVYESHPPYEHWKEVHSFGDVPVIQGDMVQFNGTLAVFFRPSDEPRFSWRSISSDEGKTWSQPLRLPLPNPLSGIAAFVMNDRIGLVYNHTSQHRRYPISVAFSDRDLHEWTTPVPLDDPGFEVSYPSFKVDGNQVVHGVYTYNRKFIKYVSFDGAWVEEHCGKD